jgi:hypothetical protein
MQLRRLTAIALVIGGLSLPARSQEPIRLFAPVPAGKIAPLEPPAQRVALSPPRVLLVRPTPAIRGSLSEDGRPAKRISPAADAPWRTAPQDVHQTAPPADWQNVAPTQPVSPRVVRSAAR